MFKGDYHTHTYYSDGRASVEAMAAAAGRLGLQELAITDHGPGNITSGVKNADVYQEVRRDAEAWNQKRELPLVLTGAEANVVSSDGQIDLPLACITALDILIVGLHPYIWPKTWSDGWNLVGANRLGHFFQRYRPQLRNMNTKALVESLYRYDVDVVAHPGLLLKIETEELAKACVKTGTAFEINTQHRFPDLPETLTAAREGVDFIVNSDAHYPETVGDFAYGVKLLNLAEIPPERILNRDS